MCCSISKFPTVYEKDCEEKMRQGGSSKGRPYVTGGGCAVGLYYYLCNKYLIDASWGGVKGVYHIYFHGCLDILSIEYCKKNSYTQKLLSRSKDNHKD